MDHQVSQFNYFLSRNIVKAIHIYEDIVYSCCHENNWEIVNDVSSKLADLLRNSCLYIRHLVQTLLSKSSLLCRICCAIQFSSVEDCCLSKFELFQEYFPKNKFIEFEPYVVAYGNNRSFNLGLLSDGSPINELRTVNVPSSQKISMSNTHSIFLTDLGKVYGCGKASSIIIDENQKTKHGFITVPTEIKLPSQGNEIFIDIATGEGFTVVLSKDFIYFIGRCEHLTNSSNGKKIGQNCICFKNSNNGKKIVTSKYCTNVIGAESNVTFGNANKFSFDLTAKAADELLGNNKTIAEAKSMIKEVNVVFQGNELKIFVFIGYEDSIHWSLPENLKPVAAKILINGCRESRLTVNKLCVASNGLIFAQFKQGFVGRGRFEFWKSDDDGFTSVESKSVMSSLVNYIGVINFEEIGGSYGVSTFEVSPDGMNSIFQINSIMTHEMDEMITDLMCQDANKDDLYTFEILNSYKAAMEHQNLENEPLIRHWDSITGPVEDFIANYDDVTKYFTIMDTSKAIRKYKILHFVFFLHQLLEYDSQPVDNKCPLLCKQNDKQFNPTEAPMDILMKRIERYELKDYLNVRLSRNGLVQTLLYASRDDVLKWAASLMLFIRECVKKIEYHMAGPMQDPVRNVCFMFVRMIKDELDNPSVREMASGIQPSYYSEDLRNVALNRVKEFDFSQDDIQLDLEITANLTSQEYVEFRKNSKIFSISNPKLMNFNENGVIVLNDVSACLTPDDKELFSLIFQLLYHAIYHRKIYSIILKRDIVMKANSILAGVDLRLVPYRKQSSDMLICRIASKIEFVDEFLPHSYNDNDVCNLVTNDGKVVMCYRYLLDIHSRHFSAMRRFNDACDGSFYSPYGDYSLSGFKDSKSVEIEEIKLNFNETVTRNAINGILNTSCLKSLKFNELCDVVLFYDYYIMNEATLDALEILFTKVTPFNIQVFYDLWETFGESVTNMFLERPELIFFIGGAFGRPSLKRIQEFTERISTKSITKDKCKSFESFDINDLMGKIVDVEQSSCLYNIHKGDSHDNIIVKANETILEKLSESFSKIMRERKNSETERKRNDSYKKSSPPASSTPLNCTPSKTSTPRSRCNSIREEMSPIKPASSMNSSPIGINSRRKTESMCSEGSWNMSSLKEEDFPSSPISLSTPLTKSKGSGKKFHSKGSRFQKADGLLGIDSPVNPWKKSSPGIMNEASSSNTSVSFMQVIEDDKNISKKISGKCKKIRPLAFIEMEQLAAEELRTLLLREHDGEASVRVDVIGEEENDDPLWGLMPGILKR